MPKLQGCDFSSRLTKARSVNEVAQVVDNIRSAIDSMPSPSKLMISISNKDYDVVESGDLLKNRIDRGTKQNPFDLEIDDSGIATPDQIKAEADLIAELHSYIADLRGARIIALSQRMSTMKSTKPLVKAIDAAIEDATSKSKRLLKVMRTSAQETMPKAFRQLASTVKKHLEEKALKGQDYTTIKVIAYAVPDAEAVKRGFIKKAIGGDGVLYQTYFHIVDLENDDGYTYQHFSIVLTARSSNKKVEYYVTSIKNERVAGTFPVGEHVTSPAKLRNTINALLSVDGFIGQFERQSIKQTTDEIRNATGMHKRGRTRVKNVKGIRVHNDSIMVKLYPSLSKAEKEKVREDVLAILGDFFRVNGRGRSVMQSRFVTGNAGNYLQVNLTPKEAKQLSMNKRKVDTMADAFGMTQVQKRELLKSILPS